MLVVLTPDRPRPCSLKPDGAAVVPGPGIPGAAPGLPRGTVPLISDLRGISLGSVEGTRSELRPLCM